MATLATKNLKFGQTFLVQCVFGSFSSFQALVCKFWLSCFAENLQFIAMFDTRPVNRPFFYWNFEGNKNSRLAKIFWFNVSLVVFSSCQSLVCKFWVSRFAESIQFIAHFDSRPVIWRLFSGKFGRIYFKICPQFSESMYAVVFLHFKLWRSCILQYQNDQKQQDYLYFWVSGQNCPILPDPIAEKLGKMSFHIG